MSFAGTPLGQNRRLDHSTFLNKPNSTGSTFQPSSYQYGAPTSSSRSPPKPSSARSADGSALARFEKYKSQQQASRAPGADLGPRTFTHNSPPKSVKDTSVNVANAFHQEALAAFPDLDPNTSAGSSSRSMNNNPHAGAWATGAQSTKTIPRSTSQEYEKETQMTRQRRANVPARRPIPKQPSGRHVPDSEGEDENSLLQVNGHSRRERGKSPIEQIVDIGRRGAQFLMKQREPAVPTDADSSNSYSYAEEDREFETLSAKRNAASQAAGHKKNRMSLDNKAYRPSASDEDDDDDEVDEDTGRRRKKKKKDTAGGKGLTTLPTVDYSKRKKKKGGKKGEDGGASDGEEGSHDAEEHHSRTGSRPRSLPPDHFDSSGATDPSFDLEQGSLDPIPEADEESARPPPKVQPRGQPSTSGIGGALGTLVNVLWRLIMAVISLLGVVLFAAGRALGSVLGKAASFAKPLALLGLIGLAIFAVQRGPELPRVSIPMPSMPWSGKYYAPGAPAADISELAARLLTLEGAMETLAKAQDSERLELSKTVGSLERGVRTARTQGEEGSRSLESVRRDLEILQAQLTAQAQQPHEDVTNAVDEARLQALEERVGTVEGGVKDAVALAKAKPTSNHPVAGWWSKLGVGSSSSLTIKSSDGQDVTALIAQMVDAARAADGGPLRVDFASYAGGALIIPSLTTDTYGIKPSGVRARFVGAVTGYGHAVGRPPVTALSPELHNGHCWPFAGSEGQLGVVLAAPAYIDSISIDHVAREVTFDIRSAPREMEVWALVEGRENVRRVKEWRAAREEGLLDDGYAEPESYPRLLPRAPEYIRIARFAYDVHAGRTTQTFSVEPAVRALGVDFGIVVLRVLNNWGRDEFTCLYRFRVHGQRVGETPLPYPEDGASISS